MIKLYDKETGAPLGEISEEQLAFLQEQLEEEGAGDQDYYINADTIDLFAEANPPAGLVELLKRALGSHEDMEIRWARE